jgi:phospholipid/cholesterol/gamma-HCH transport system substrate-binding protein
MPIQTKAKWARLRVGILAIAAMVILTTLIFLITGHINIFESNAVIFTYMSDAAALAVGAPVNLNGIPVGKVKAITLSGSKEPRRIVKIEMEMPEHTLKSIPLDSLASISAANVLGTKYINIKEGKSETVARSGQEIPSLNTAEFDDVVQQGYAVLTSLQGTVERVDKIVARIDNVVGIVESGKGSIGKLLVDETLYNHILGIVDQARLLADALNTDKGTLGKLIYSPELYNGFRTTLGRLDNLMQGLQEGKGTAGLFLRDRAMYDELNKTVADFHKIVEDINAGKGTAGKLLKSDELHKQVQDSLSKIDLMIDKVNSGQGTIGQLLVNQQLYDNLNGATREMHLLMKDFRANPKKFLRIKLGLF